MDFVRKPSVDQENATKEVVSKFNELLRILSRIACGAKGIYPYAVENETCFLNDRITNTGQRTVRPRG